MKKVKLLLSLLLISTSTVYARANLDGVASEMENEIAGGKDRPQDIKVQFVKNRFFLRGVVDKTSEKNSALEVCVSYAAKYLKLDQSKFKSVRDLCVDLVKVRVATTVDPSALLRIEYRVISIPDAQTGVTDLMSNKFYNSEDFPKDARLLKSMAINLVDGEDGSLSSESFASQSSYPQPAATAISSEKFSVNPDDSSKGRYSLETVTRAKSVAGTEKINVDTDVHLSNSEIQLERRMKTRMVVNNKSLTPIGSWIHLEQKDLKNSALSILLRVEKLQSLEDMESPLQ